MFYTGVGSRETPEATLSFMTTIATILSHTGIILRSGAAPGADQAFELGSNPEYKEIYLPWEGFEKRSIKEIGVAYNEPESWTYEVAANFHPAWKYMSKIARKFHARNVHQILGRTPNSELSKFVICWTKDGKGGGGTGQAIRIANGYDIPVIDLGKR